MADTTNIPSRQSAKAPHGNTRHGYAAGRGKRGLKRSEYKIWTAMISRCYREADSSFHLYGARGITVCERWRYGEGGLSGFECFIADMGDRPPKHSIDRVKNSLGYIPSNCTWADGLTQNRNRRNTLMVEWRGRTLPLAEACEIAGMKYTAVTQRIHKLGWSVEKALTQPKMRSRWG